MRSTFIFCITPYLGWAIDTAVVPVVVWPVVSRTVTVTVNVSGVGVDVRHGRRCRAAKVG